MIARLPDPAAAQAWCAQRRARGARLGFVPTMGALHEGHLDLVRAARSLCDAVCVSVFVNPLQFDDPRDFERYPRDFAADSELLATAGCDMAFTGTLAQFFPGTGGDLAAVPRRDPGPRARGLEGEHRPGHFEGVATIVARLFDVVRPNVGFFGAKDFQQTLVVEDLARDRGGPRIVVVPTSREPSGLARSSRNALLSVSGRAEAAALYGALERTRAAWAAGERDATALARTLTQALESAALELEYAALRDPERWTVEEPTGRLERAVALVAARVERVRLIDNLRLDEAPAA